ncbi:MAG: hypothetical protein ABIT09_09035 [Croceibacterium sp.]
MCYRYSTHAQPALDPHRHRRPGPGHSPSAIPFLGWGNWIVLPIAVVGIGLGALSRSKSGRNFCLIVFVVAVVRLMLGGGII